MKLKSALPALTLLLTSALPVNAQNFQVSSVSSTGRQEVDLDSIEVSNDGKRTFISKLVRNNGTQDFYLDMVDCRNPGYRLLAVWDFNSKRWNQMDRPWMPMRRGTTGESTIYLVCTQPVRW